MSAAVLPYFRHEVERLLGSVDGGVEGLVRSGELQERVMSVYAGEELLAAQERLAEQRERIGRDERTWRAVELLAARPLTTEELEQGIRSEPAVTEGILDYLQAHGMVQRNGSRWVGAYLPEQLLGAALLRAPLSSGNGWTAEAGEWYTEAQAQRLLHMDAARLTELEGTGMVQAQLRPVYDAQEVRALHARLAQERAARWAAGAGTRQAAERDGTARYAGGQGIGAPGMAERLQATGQNAASRLPVYAAPALAERPEPSDAVGDARGPAAGMERVGRWLREQLDREAAEFAQDPRLRRRLYALTALGATVAGGAILADALSR